MVATVLVVIPGTFFWKWGTVRSDGPINKGILNQDSVGQGYVKVGDIYTYGYVVLINYGDEPARIDSLELLGYSGNAVEVGPYAVAAPTRKSGQLLIAPGYPPVGDFSVGGELEEPKGFLIPPRAGDPDAKGVLVAVRLIVKRAENVTFSGMRVRYTYKGKPYEYVDSTRASLCLQSC